VGILVRQSSFLALAAALSQVRTSQTATGKPQQTNGGKTLKTPGETSLASFIGVVARLAFTTNYPL
jgi:hypothetical protein